MDFIFNSKMFSNSMLWMEPRASCRLGKPSASQLFLKSAPDFSQYLTQYKR
jgi:hypothetical protein